MLSAIVFCSILRSTGLSQYAAFIVLGQTKWSVGAVFCCLKSILLKSRQVVQMPEVAGFGSLAILSCFMTPRMFACDGTSKSIQSDCNQNGEKSGANID